MLDRSKQLSWISFVGLLIVLVSFTSAHADDLTTNIMEPMIVTAGLDENDFSDRRDATTTRLVYGREELDRMNELSVGDYLRRLPGVTFTGPPGTPKDVRMRGMDKGYTQILINGEEVLSGTKERQIQVDRIPLDMVERIEVIRAPSADMSNEGLTGTINIVLREVPRQPVAGVRLVGGRIFGKKTDKDTWNLSGHYGDSGERLGWLLSLSGGQVGALKSKGKSEETFNAGTGARTGWKKEYEDERVTTDTFDVSTRLTFSLSDRNKFILTPWITQNDESKIKTLNKFKFNNPVTGEDYVSDGSKKEEEDKLRETGRLRGEWQFQPESGGNFSWYIATQYGKEKKDKTALEYNAAEVLTKTTIERDRKNEKEWYSGVRYERPVGQHKLSTGIEYKDKHREDEKDKLENGSPKDGGRGDNFDITEKRWTLWLQDEIHVGRGHYLTPGLRMIHNTQSAVDQSGTKTSGRTRSASPSIHWLWQLNDSNNLRASVTESLKPPKFDDLSSVTESDDGTLSKPDKSGNPDLKPEKALGVEVGWDYFMRRNGGVLGVNLFYRDISDMVEKRSKLESGRYVERPYNVGDAKVWGAELDARAGLGIVGLPNLMLRFNYTWLDSEIEDKETGKRTRIKDQPPYVYNVGFDWKLPDWKAAWGVNYNFTPKFVKNPTEPLKKDDEAEQKLLDMYITKQLSHSLSLRLTVANLLDMSKDKDKYEYNNDKQLTKFIQESERGGRAFYAALEGRF